jgi:regulator of sigma E protease
MAARLPAGFTAASGSISMSFVFTLAAFALTLGILIVVHEFGHYLVARLSGIRVLRFSIGFGKPLYLKRLGKDQTEWVIAAFPLGGYVKMLDEREGEVAAHELHRAFNRQSIYRRTAVVIAGPLANLLLAIFLYWFLFMYGMQGFKPILDGPPAATPAARAAFARGDEIVRIDGEKVSTWQDVRWALLQRAAGGRTVTVEVRSGRGEVHFRHLDLSSLTPEDLDRDFLGKLGLAHYRPDLEPKIGRLLPGGAAEKAGLQPGDEIVAINQAPIRFWEEAVQWVRQNPGKPLRFTIRRGERQFSVELTPLPVTENGKTMGRIGAAPAVERGTLGRLIRVVRYPPGQALYHAAAKTWDTSVFTLKMLGRMVAGQVSWKNVSGPITIADYAGQSAQMGWAAYLNFLALISISLGVLNLLPIPLLDGGHLLYHMAEIIRGKPISEKAMEIGQQIGLAILLTLMLLAFYNDIHRLITGQ